MPVITWGARWIAPSGEEPSLFLPSTLAQEATGTVIAFTLGDIVLDVDAHLDSASTILVTLDSIAVDLEAHVEMGSDIAFTLLSIIPSLSLGSGETIANTNWLTAAANAQSLAGLGGNYKPIFGVHFPELDRTFTSREVTFADTELFLARLDEQGLGAITIDLDERTDIPRLGNTRVRLINTGGLIQTFDTGLFDNAIVQISVGFTGLAEADWLLLYTGILDRHTITLEYIDLDLVDITLHERVNLSISVGPPFFPSSPLDQRGNFIPLYFGVHGNAPTIQCVDDVAATGTLAFDVTAADDELLLLPYGNTFPDTGTVTIGSESLTYAAKALRNINGKTHLVLATLTRTAPVVHVAGETVTLATPAPAFLVGFGVTTLNAVRSGGIEQPDSAYDVSTVDVNGYPVVVIHPDFAVTELAPLTVDINAQAPVPSIPLNHTADVPQPVMPPDPSAPTERLVNGGFETGDETGWTEANGGSLVVGSGVAGLGDLATNGGFETGNGSGWTTANGGSLAVEAMDPYAGTYRGALTGNMGSYGDLRQDIAVTPNVLHELTFAYQNAPEAVVLMNGDFSAPSAMNLITSWTIVDNTNAVITSGDHYNPLNPNIGVAGLRNHILPQAGYTVVLTHAAMPNPAVQAFYADFSVEFYQDFATDIGTTYLLSFQYFSPEDRVSVPMVGWLVRRTRIEYKVGTPADDEDAIPLTWVAAQTIYLLDGQPQNGVFPTVPFLPAVTLVQNQISGAIPFVATGTTTRLSFVLSATSDGSISPTNILIPLACAIDSVTVIPVEGVDHPSAAYQLGTTGDMDLYAAATLPHTTNWNGVGRRFIPTTSPVRVTLQSRYARTSLPTYIDAVMLQEVDTVVIEAQEGTYRAELTGGLNGYGDIYQDIETEAGVPHNLVLAYQTAKIATLLVNGDFAAGGLQESPPGWTILRNIDASTLASGTTKTLQVRDAFWLTLQRGASSGWRFDMYQDITTVIGLTYTLDFQYRTVQNRLTGAWSSGEELSDLGYKVGTVADDDSIIPLTFVGQSEQATDGRQLTIVVGGKLVPPPPGHVSTSFVATATTTRISFYLQADETITGLRPANYQKPSVSARIYLIYPTVELGGTNDTSQAALQIGTPATPSAYITQDLAAANEGWAQDHFLFVPTAAVTRVTLRARYTLTALPVYWDALSILPQPLPPPVPGAPPSTSTAQPAPVVLLANDQGENPVDLALALISTYVPTSLVNLDAFMQARGQLSQWKFTGVFTNPGFTDDLLYRIGNQSNSLVMKDTNGAWTWTVLDDSRESVAPFNPGNISEGSFARASGPADAVYSSIAVYFNTLRGGSTSPEDYRGATFVTPTETSAPGGEGLVAQAALAQSNYRSEQRLDFFADFIHDFDTANLLLAQLVSRYCKRPLILSWRTFIDAAPIRPGQLVRVTHRLLPFNGAEVDAEVIGWHYNPPSTELELVTRSLRATGGIGWGVPPDPPVANDDITSTETGVEVSLDILANDTASPGTNLNPRTVDLDPATLGRQVHFAITGEGSFTVDNEGIVTFVPDPVFVGSSVATYIVRDEWGTSSNEATITVTVALGVALIFGGSGDVSFEPGLAGLLLGGGAEGGVSDVAFHVVLVGGASGGASGMVTGGTGDVSFVDGGGGFVPDTFSTFGDYPGNGHADIFFVNDLVVYGADIIGAGENQGYLLSGGNVYPTVISGSELQNAGVDGIQALCSFGGFLYSALFVAGDGVTLYRCATPLSGADSTVLWNYATATVTRMLAFDSRLYIASTEDVQSDDGSNSPIEELPVGCSDLAVHATKLYATSGSDLYEATASTMWTNIHTFTGTAVCVASFGSLLAVGVHNGAAREVWLWDGVMWTQTVILTNSAYTLHRILAYNSKLYAGFTSGIEEAPLYTYDGAWHLNQSFTDWSSLRTLLVDTGSLYVGIGGLTQWAAVRVTTA